MNEKPDFSTVSITQQMRHSHELYNEARTVGYLTLKYFGATSPRQMTKRERLVAAVREASYRVREAIHVLRYGYGSGE